MKQKITILFLAFFTSVLSAQTVKIGATTYPNITDAITAANDGDVILIEGIHTEPISVSKSITLRGVNPTTDIIQAAAAPSTTPTGSRVISLTSATNTDALTITIENLGIRHGNSDANGGGINADKIMGMLTLRNLIITNNYTTTNGGGLGMAGSNATIINCTIQNNVSLLDGGGIIAAPNNNNGNGINAVVNIQQSLINNNNGRNGGGIYLNGNNNFGNNYKIDMIIENSTISNNTTTSLAGGNGGGAIFTASANLVGSSPLVSNVTLRLVHATVFNNTHAAAAKSGLQFAGANSTNFSSYNSIIVANDDVNIKALNLLNTNTTNVVNCILGGLENSASFLTIIDDAAKNNLKGRTATQAGISGTLTNEGGATQVFAIGTATNAIDFCTATTGISLPTTDQRGATRSGTADAGSFELGGTLSVNDAITKSNDVKIFPNPAKEFVSIGGINTVESVKIYSILGALEKVIYNQKEINVSNLSSGIYMMVIESDAKRIIKRIIIE